jgi:uracil-DNA glycosylase family 4
MAEQEKEKGMSFRSLFTIEVGDKPTKSSGGVKPRGRASKSNDGSGNTRQNRSKRSSKGKERGCAVCPLNEVPGIQKIMGHIRGKAILLIAQSPGFQENEEGMELIGPAGEFLWAELRRVGILRKHVDIQNAVRCFPADLVEGSYNSYLKMRPPTPEEVRCCSLHMDRALEKHKAKQILIFGQIAAKAVLNTRSLPAQKTFWSEELNARVYLLDHPAFFVRGYGKGPRLDQFRSTLDRVASDRDIVGRQGKTISDQFAYIRQQDYRLVLNKKQAIKAKRILLKYAAKGKRIAVDIESDKFPPDDAWRVIGCGFCPRPGLSFFFVFRHKDQKSKDGVEVAKIAKSILEDEAVEKALQFGCSDEDGLLQFEQCELEGYTHDTYLSEYLRFSDKKAYGLEAIAESRYPDFSGYKLIRTAELMKAAAEAWQEEHPNKKLPKVFSSSIDVQDKYLDSHKLIRMRNLSLETLRLYNGGDCDLTKRIEISNKNKIPQALMRLYIDLGRLLYKMDPAGPTFDYEQHEKLAIVTPKQADLLKAKLRKIIKNKKFNPGSPPQVYDALYNKLGLDYPFRGEPNTRKMALLMLGRAHAFPRLVLDWRKADKVKGILKSYKRSADAHGGRLRTKWKATGTRTGRLAAGSERNKKDSTIINLQNIKRDPQIQNMCVADPRWRKFYEAATKIVHEWGRPITDYWKECRIEIAKAKLEGRKPELRKKRKIERKSEEEVERLLEAWIRANMPDLKTYLILDYGQVEVRVAAQLSGDKNLQKDCESADIHTTVGVTMTHWDSERIKNDEATRTLTKNCIAAGQLVLTNVGPIPIEKVTKSMLVWDGQEFVPHDGVICKGKRRVIAYAGLVATPDHLVWTSAGEKVKLGYAAENRLELAVTGVESSPVRYTSDSVGCIPARSIQVCHDDVYGVQKVSPGIGRQHQSGYVKQLRVPATSQIPRSKSTDPARAIFSYKAALRKPKEPELGQLRRPRHPEQVQHGSRFCSVHAISASASYLSWSGNRQERQPWPLRAWKSSTSFKSYECTQHPKKRVGEVQGTAHSCYSSCAATERRLPRGDAKFVGNSLRASARAKLEKLDTSQGQGAVQEAVVYDIVNAGPRHRFTVSGHLVSNCHFGILFGISKDNLFEFVVAMSPEDMRDRITREEVELAYDNYFRRYKGILRFIAKQRAFAKENKFVTTAFGMIQTLNVTEDHKEDMDYVDDDEFSERGSYWGNQAINGPVQGTAHQIMICALVNLLRQRRKYAILGIPPMEVHDALYFAVPVLEMFKALSLAKYLLEKESLKTVASDFPAIKWKVPIMVDAKAGIRLGTKVKVDEKMSIGQYLLDWYKVCSEQDAALDKLLLGAA